MKPIGACIFVVSFLMIFASLVRFDVFVMPPGGSKMLVVDVSIGPYQWLGRSPSHHEVLTPVQLLLRLQNHHHHTQSATTTTPQTSLAMDQEEKKQVQSIRDQLKGHSLPDGSEIVGSINSSSSEFNATNNRAHIVRQSESGSTASDRKTTRETPNLFSSEDLRQYVVSLRRLIGSHFFTFCCLCSRVKPPPNAQYPYPYQYPYPFPYQYPYPRYIPPENLQQYFGHKRADVAARLGVSVSTLKRMCRGQGIPRWRNRMGSSGSVSKPPDQHGEGNISTARETPSLHVQTWMGGEPVGQNQEANVLRRDFMGGPIALNTESGLIMVARPPDQHGEKNTSTACEVPSHNVETEMEIEPVGQNQEANLFQRDFTDALNTENGLIMVSRAPDQHGERNASTACGTPSRNVETGMEVEPVGQNPEANVFRRDFMGGPIALNTDDLTFLECSDAAAPSQPMATILDTIPHLTGGSSECAFQVKNQSTQFIANPYPNGLVDPHPQIALTQILSENMERLEDRRNLFAPQKVPLPEGHVFGSVNWTVRSCSDLALSQPMPTIPHTTECSEYWRNSLALLEEYLLEENDYGSINLTALSCFDPGPSQPMHTIPHAMPTIPQMMPLLTERQDMRSVRLKATYGNTTIKFPLPSGFSELKEEVSKRLKFERGSFKLEYKDEEGDSVLIACDEDVRDYLRLLTSLGNQVVKLFVLDKVPNTTNFCDNCGCDNCRSLKCKRP